MTIDGKIRARQAPARWCSRWLPASVVLIFLAACASYQQSPLPRQSALAPSVAALVLDKAKPALPGLRTHPFDPSDGLDMTETATLAVLNNPALTALRKRRGVAKAELFAAGLLPDPQVTFSFDHPTSDGAGLINAAALALAYDLLPLITRGARVDAAAANRHRVDLELLWREWQVAQQARILYVRYLSEQHRMALLKKSLALYRRRYRLSSKALAAGNVKLDVAGTDLTVLVDTYSRLNRLKQAHAETDNALTLLLGLKPDAPLALGPLSRPTPFAPALARSQLKTVPDRRPDLLALKAGYASQEARVRKAVLAQFPAINVGINRARDTGAVYTNGFSVSLSLPIFSANRGAIAVQRATRERLRQEYRARLAATEATVGRLLRTQRLIAEARRILATYMPRLKRMVEGARRAYATHDINALTFLNMETTWINKQLEQQSLVQSQWESRIALDTALAWRPRGRFARAGKKPAPGAPQ